MESSTLRCIAVVGFLAACGEVKPQDPGGDDGDDDGDGDGDDGGSSAEEVVRYDFDDGLAEGEGGELRVVDTSGNDRDGVLRSANGGDAELELVDRDGGQALQFPGRCEEEPSLCPRLVMEASATADANPGERDFAAGADVLVAAAVSEIDQNVMQKGNFDDPGQWKIEVTTDGRPRCIFHYPEEEGGQPVILASEARVDDEAWHSVICERAGDDLVITVDGDTAERAIPTGQTLDMANHRPVMVGGRDTGASSDQFYGAVDNAFYELR
jgi:Laminin G domain